MASRPPSIWLDKADRHFLEDGLARGMSVAEIAGFLNRSEDEIKGYLTRSSSCPWDRGQGTTNPVLL
jgi:IS30 family transposase